MLCFLISILVLNYPIVNMYIYICSSIGLIRCHPDLSPILIRGTLLHHNSDPLLLTFSGDGNCLSNTSHDTRQLQLLNETDKGVCFFNYRTRCATTIAKYPLSLQSHPSPMSGRTVIWRPATVVVVSVRLPSKRTNGNNNNNERLFKDLSRR